jgi:hypothetical protein
MLFLIYANAALQSTNGASSVTDTSYVEDVCIVVAATRANTVISILQARTNEQMHRAESL